MSALIPRKILLSIFLSFFFIFTVCANSFSEDYTATIVDDFGDVAVMEFIGNLDASTVEDGYSSSLQTISSEFYTNYADQYDFLVVFSGFDFQMPEEDKATGFYHSIRNDVQGIGQILYDSSSNYGSDGQLQGVIVMGSLKDKISDPLDPEFTRTMTVLSHEILHRWAAFVSFLDQGGSPSMSLLGKSDSHWNFLLDTDGSLMYGNNWQNNGDGTFTALPGRKYYSELDLYLMGLIDKDDVSDMMLIENPEIDPERLPATGETISGTARAITIEDIIAAEGERIPSVHESQKQFRVGTVVIVRPGEQYQTEVGRAQLIMDNWPMWYSALTDGKSAVVCDAALIEDIPENPGAGDLPYDPRQTPPEIVDGVDWLIANQSNDGSWQDTDLTMTRDTTLALLALDNFSTAQSNCSAGLDWLSTDNSANSDFLAKTAEVLAAFNEPLEETLDKLRARQNIDGGWGADENKYNSNPLDTASILRALTAGGVVDLELVFCPIVYLLSTQQAGGGWGSDTYESDAGITAGVLSALSAYTNDYDLEEPLQNGLAWLLGKRNVDGGFGNSPSTVFDTAMSLVAMKNLNGSELIQSEAVDYILGTQSENGSWHDSVCQTAVAVNSIWDANRQSDLSVETGDITITPAELTSLPASVGIHAEIANKGLTDVSEVEVAFYQGGISEEGLVATQTIAVNGYSSTGVNFTVDIATGGTYYLYIVIDSNNLVEESCETNNKAMKILYPGTTFDFEILDTDVSVAPETVGILDPVTITAQIRNKGAQDAYNVPVKYFIDGQEIAASTVSFLPCGDEITKTFVWNADIPGTLNVSVDIDPDNAYSELSETNNTGSVELVVTPSTQSNLTVSYEDIIVTPSDFQEGGSAEITVNIGNNGFLQVDNVNVNVYNGTPDEGGLLIGTSIVASIVPGETTSVTVSWDNIPVSGEQMIYVEVDADGMVDEIRDDDNNAFIEVDVLSLPDLAVSPAAITVDPPISKEGDVVDVMVLIQNAGEQDAVNVKAILTESGNEIDTVLVPVIAGNDSHTASFTYDTTGKMGAHEITVTVDPDNEITEQNESNNTASRGLGVQDANLWLTERYISPNGDGIKDATRFFFNLSSQQTVYIAIVDDNNVVVRLFSGPAYENTMGGDILWDGLNEKGSVVDDGEYRIQVRQEDEGIIASLPVTVDNNRLPLMDAIGTKYLYEMNMTPELPYFYQYDWQWFSDQSGILFYVPYTRTYAPDYPRGLYTMAPDGGNIVRLVPPYWKEAPTSADYEYIYRAYTLSPDETQVAILLEKRLNRVIQQTQIWTVGRYAENLNEVISYDYEREENGETINQSITGLAYSPDGSKLAYSIVEDRSGVKTGFIYVINIDGTGNTKVVETPLASRISIKEIVWSPDNARLAYVYENSGWDGQDNIVMVDLAGNAVELLSILGPVRSLDWLTPESLVMKCDYNGFMAINDFWFLDASGANNHVKLAEKVRWSANSYLPTVVMNPNGQGFAFAGNTEEKWNVNVCDNGGNCQVVYEAPLMGDSYWLDYNLSGEEDYYYDIASLVDLRWSPDGKTLAFLDLAFEPTEGWPGTCSSSHFPVREFYQSALILLDVNSGDYKIHEIDTQYACFSDSFHIFTNETGDWGEAGVIHFAPRSTQWLTSEYLELTEPALINPDGSLTIKIVQQGSDEAAIRDVCLYVDYVRYEPVQVINTSTGENVTDEILDFECEIDAHEQTFELTWENLPVEYSDIGIDLTASEITYTYRDESLQWLGNDMLLWTEGKHSGSRATGWYGDFRLIGMNRSDGSETPIPGMTWGYVSPLHNILTWENQGLWGMMSLLNLTTELHLSRVGSAVQLKGTAMDLYFDHYILEYADVNTPDTWQLIQPPSDIPVVDDVFGTWVPPSTGSYYVRLTVFDKAGNSRMRRVRLSWHDLTSITNLYKTNVTFTNDGNEFFGDGGLFSPMTDSTKDAVALHYTVRAPVHLQFTVTDENGNTIKTVERDYASVPEEGSEVFIWDGRDEEGNLTPDGNYVISVLDYEYYIKVDRTLPSVSINLGDLNIYNKPETVVTDNGYQFPTEAGTFAANLSYSVSDSNLAFWIIEWGEGVYPEEWNEYLSGYESESPDIWLTEDDLEFAVGKKFRITAVDHAGNIFTQTTNKFFDETLLVNHWEVPSSVNQDDIDKWKRPDPNPNGIPPYYVIPYDPAVYCDVTWQMGFSEDPWWLVLSLTPDDESPSGFASDARLPELFTEPGTHAIRGFESIRLPITTLTFQHWGNSMEWVDGETIDYPESGTLELEWDNTVIEDARLIRLKAEDEMGGVHYSNTIVVKPLLEAWVNNNCDAWFNQLVIDGLDTLTFQMKYAEGSWEDYQTFIRADGDAMPNGLRQVFPLPEINNPLLKSYRIIGVDTRGRTHISNDINFSHCIEISGEPTNSIRIEYLPSGSDCGNLIQSAEFSVVYGDGAPLDFQSISFYLIDRQERILLGSSEFPDYQVTVDFEGLAEGVKQVEAVLQYIEAQPSTLIQKLLVDKTLPATSIEYSCILKYKGDDAYKYGLDVKGLANDDFLTRWDLYFGVGENPEDWHHALRPEKKENEPITQRWISGTSSISGDLEEWELTYLSRGTYSLKLQAEDSSGNVSCYHTPGIYFDPEPVLTVSSPNRKIFSPNGDGVMDDVSFDFTLSQESSVYISVSKTDTSTSFELASGQYSAGVQTFIWDGSGANSDGPYEIFVKAIDLCGNVGSETVEVAVDTTPPEAVISYPITGAPLGIEVESVGRAWDANFLDYTLMVADVGTPGADPLILAQAGRPVENDLLGSWNTFDYSGQWTFLLTVRDQIGNITEVPVTVDLGDRMNLIKSLNVEPRIFSPNNDGVLDLADIGYELNPDIIDTYNVTLTFSSEGQVSKTIQMPSIDPGEHHFVWDGKNDQAPAVVVPDGTYSVSLSVYANETPLYVHEETVTVVVDTTPPEVIITSPVANSFLKYDLSVEGTITDENLDEYQIDCLSQGEVVFSEQGLQSQENYQFALFEDSPEAEYVVEITAADLAGNETSVNIPCVVDKTPPDVEMLTPETGALFGGDESTLVNISASIEELYLVSWTLRYGPGEEPEPGQWQELATGTSTLNEETISEWPVGPESGIDDGIYTISLLAEDMAGWQGEAIRLITVDNTPPMLEITAPASGSYISEPTSIVGSVQDMNFLEYTVELSSGDCSSAFQWGVLFHGETEVAADTLAGLANLPADGTYCLKLTAVDKVGNASEQTTEITVDTMPPQTPIALLEPDGRTACHISWFPVEDSDLAGYRVYRDGQLIASLGVAETAYHDTGLENGAYSYTVKAVDHAQLASAPSNEMIFIVDLNGPVVRLTVPQDGAVLNDLVEIKGTAFCEEDFKQYRVYIGVSHQPTTWNLIRTSPVPIPYGVLAVLEQPLTDGSDYCVKLEAEDLSGNTSTCRSSFTIDDVAPETPVLVSVTANAADVDIVWEANTTDSDIAGYLLYRNGELVNANGPVVGGLSPYLLAGTTYNDPGLADGEYTYHLETMDLAGNISPPSNAISVTVNVRAPQAIITSPVDGYEFEHPIIIKAACEDLDLSSIQIQYRAQGAASWTNLGGPLTNLPYMISLDPVALAMAYGNYDIRAVAEDNTGNVDANPASITVVYTDLTPPAAPVGLTAQVTGGQITFNWTGNTEGDLAGYNIYKLIGNSQVLLNQELITDTAFIFSDVADGEYSFSVQAVDTFENESALSENILVTVYTPVVEQPDTPVCEESINVTGNGVVPGSTVSVLIDSLVVAQVDADTSGAFTADLVLNTGENTILVSAQDAAGNVSKRSEVFVVYNPPPAPPANPATSVTGYDCEVFWDANTESDVVEYNIYRNGEKLNVQQHVNLDNATALASSSINNAGRAIDNDDGTYWNGFVPVANLGVEYWWQLTLQSAELISGITVNWRSFPTSGRDYEIQAWVESAWLPIAEVMDNEELSTAITFYRPYLTDKIRIFIFDTNTVNAPYKYAHISEVTLTGPYDSTLYTDYGLTDGTYTYQISAVNQYGCESLLSNPVFATVGDAEPPAPPTGLTAEVNGSGTILAWADNTESDLVGYNVYRKSGDNWTLLTPATLTTTGIIDTVLIEGTYTYRVTAVDHVGNESLPAEVVAIITSAGLEQVRITSVLSSPEGGAVQVCWNDPTKDAVGFNIYRSETPGGPYTLVNSSLLTGTCYVDEDLINDVTYYYTITGVDEVGNESNHSDEVEALAEYRITLVKPMFFGPTVHGQPVDVSESCVDISGTAAPGSSVELYRNGTYMGSVMADENVHHQTLPLTFDERELYSEVFVSPDEKKTAYLENKTDWSEVRLVLMDISSGNADPVVTTDGDMWDIEWSPDSTRILYALYSYDTDIVDYYFYDLTTNSSVLLMDDSATNSPWDASWSFDGNQVIFVTENLNDGLKSIRIKDLQTGAVTLVKQTSDPDDSIFTATMSYDNRYIGYYLYNYYQQITKIVVLDIESGNEYDAEHTPYGSVFHWAPDANRILFPTRTGSEKYLSVYDVDTDTSFIASGLITTSYWMLYDWCGDSGRIVYVTEENGQKAVKVAPTDFPNQSRSITSIDTPYLSHLQASSSNGLWLLEGRLYSSGEQFALHRYNVGAFLFDQVGLEMGNNVFQAVSVGDTDEVSPWSDSIVVTLDPDALPDLSVSTDDFFFYPQTPREGEIVIGSVAVANPRAIDVDGVNVTVDVFNADGYKKSVAETTIDHLPADSVASVNFSWDSTGRAGEYTIRVTVDPEDLIQEANETNNSADQKIFVTNDYGSELSLVLDSDQYIRGDTVEVTLGIVNSGVAVDATLDVWLTDANGDTVSEQVPENISLKYGDMRQVGCEFETIDIYEGDYTAHAQISDAEGVLDEATVPFAINPDLNIEASLSTDSFAYGAGQDVSLDLRINNNGASSFNVSGSFLRITDNSGTEMFAQEFGTMEILSGAFVTENALWNTGLNPPGTYYAEVQVFAQSGDLGASADIQFEIIADATVTGTLTVDPLYINPGNEVNAEYTLYNNGNSSVFDVPVDIVLLHPVTGAVIDTFNDTVNVEAGGNVSGLVPFDTVSLSLAAHTVSLRAEVEGNTRTLASGTFTVADAVPPALTVISPEEGSTFHDDFYMVVDVFDDMSAIESVTYSLDGYKWYPIPSTDPSIGRYSVRFSPDTADEGTRVFLFQATDTSHNTPENPVEVTIHIVPKVEISATLESNTFGMHEPVTGEITLTNTGWEKQVTVTSAIETSDGDPVASFDPGEIILTKDGTSTLGFAWNTGALPPGDYRLRTQIAGNGALLNETLVPFVIVPVLNLSINTATDKTEYSLNEDVSADITVTSLGNYAVSPTVEVNIIDAGNQVLFSGQEALPLLGHNDSSVYSCTWNTGVQSAGTCRVLAKALVNDQVVAETEVPFVINPVIVVNGTVTAALTVPLGNPVHANYTLANAGNVSLVDLPIALSLIEIDTGQMVTTHEATTALAIGQNIAGNADLDTTGLQVNTYMLTLSATYEATVHTLAQIEVTLTDNVAPQITVVSPQSGDIFNALFMIVADVLDDASGVGLVEYRFDEGDWQPLPNTTGSQYAVEYTPVEADAGAHAVSFRATDQAGNVSPTQSVDIFIEFFQAFRELTGELTLSPALALQETIVSFNYMITNPADENIENLTIRAEVTDVSSGQILDTLEKTVTIDAGVVMISNFEWAANVTAGIYAVALSVALDAPIDPRTLDEAELEILERPGITIDQQVDGQSTNLLVWLNDDCEMVCSVLTFWEWLAGKSAECYWTGCVRNDLLEAALNQAVSDYRIVTDKDEFADEIRNPYYTDVLILGNDQGMDSKMTAEVMERVNGGMGIVSSKWFQHTLDVSMPFDLTSIFGVSLSGLSYSNDYTVTTVASPISGGETITHQGKACKVSADSDAVVAGWIESSQFCWWGEKTPGIVLSQYGQARTVYFAFDLGLTLEEDYDKIVTLLTNAIQYVHGNQNSFAPGDMVPVTNLINTTAGGYDYTITQTYDEALKLYDPISNSWITDNPWQFDVDLDSDQTKELSFYYLMPDSAGAFNVETETGLIFEDEYIPLASSQISLGLPADRAGLYNLVIDDIDALDVPFWDHFTIYLITQKLKTVRDRSISSQWSLECNIVDIISATHSLMLLSCVDTTDIRQQLDTLLKLEQGRYYLYQE